MNDSSTEPETSAKTPDVSARKRRLFSSPSASTSVAVRDTAVATTRRAARPARTAHPIRTMLTVAAVAGMVATVTIPAIGSRGGESAEAAVTVQQVAADNAQSLVIASEATPQALNRGGYSATTPEEIQKKKDEEAAKAAAAARIAAAAAAAKANAAAARSGSAATYNSAPVAQSIAAAGSVVRPLTFFNNFGTPYAGHKGTDYMVGRYTPIYAIADGVVVASTEAGPGWGVYVKIAHNIGGSSVTSLYAHMTYGSRRVQVGDTVSAGQLIGQVGDTGRAFGTHLHLEIYVNGSWVYPESWLVANAG